MRRTRALKLLLAGVLSLVSLRSPAWASGDKEKIDPEFQAVTCASVIKLTHVSSGFKLHSHGVNYGTGSGQQSVTGFPNPDDTNSYFVVRAAFGQECARGDPIPCDSIIRLEHLNTHKFLHSHSHKSPLSSNAEVSAYPSPGDSGDNWKIHCLTRGSKVWRREESVRLHHVETAKYLGASSTLKYGNPINGQIEVAGYVGAGVTQTTWRANEGIYFTDNTIS
ncbi:stromal cell-derived factor 2-like protein 1-like protein [Gonapodya prolifera JEL478]|uniref:Stromal cell-derived factor 2-like protein 1-like protein n=1 Tax=Gonapodya prolifera (strain JEL478) TaxID=1344416 RepID=A0A139A8S1_GONPJ|nr:stromal cell-derived factor 2-like protein 1-like protein [Gonapodya prolifera JEL478]|eukprot:KXS13192.1 stromal cell-derived factor 2-like protein 1-like protein [Gonapodya prolifera JEL478]